MLSRYFYSSAVDLHAKKITIARINIATENTPYRTLAHDLALRLHPALVPALLPVLHHVRSPLHHKIPLREEAGQSDEWPLLRGKILHQVQALRPVDESRTSRIMTTVL